MVLDCQWLPGQKAKRKKDGGVELTFKATGLLEVKRWILGWGRHVRVLGPAELRNAVAEEIRAMGEQNREQEGKGD